MQKLIVRNFGPIRELDLDIKDLSVFIGEQATGKSTVAKLVYFFKKVVKDELMAYLDSNKEILAQENEKAMLSDFYMNIQMSLPKILGANSSPFEINYKYKEDVWLHIGDYHSKTRRRIIFAGNQYQKFLSETGNTTLLNKLNGIFNKIIIYRKKYTGREWILISPSASEEIEKKEKRYEIEKIVHDFFGENIHSETIFIPAGRNMLTALAERLPNKGWDMLMERFRDKIADLKPVFGKPLLDIIKDKKSRGNGIPDSAILDLVLEKIREILKGEYRVDKDGEKLYFNEDKFVKISLASSGQQEVVWILLQLFILILNRGKTFLIIEEPEAHLFPKAQKSLVELITLLFNENNSQVFITTHSPYILTSFNNLIYAQNVGLQHEEVGDIIPKPLWLDSDRIGAYKLGNGVAEDLIDKETKMIKAEELDTVSRTINEDFDALLNLELQ